MNRRNLLKTILTGVGGLVVGLVSGTRFAFVEDKTSHLTGPTITFTHTAEGTMASFIGPNDQPYESGIIVDEDLPLSYSEIDMRRKGLLNSAYRTIANLQYYRGPWDYV